MTPFFGTLDSLLKNAVPFMQTTLGDGNSDSAKAQDQILSRLIHESAFLPSTARLEPCGATLSEFLHRCAAVLQCPTTRPLLRSKILLLLSNFFLYNVSLRKSAANSEQICLAVFHCLKAALDEHLGPQNVIDVLRIIQMLTYERVSFGDWVNDLLPFLTKQILATVPSELLPYCMCILCNLVSQSKPFTSHFKQMESFKIVCTRILQLLSHNSKAVVVSALVLVGYLDAKSRDTVYSPQNIAQTFLCVFNILSSASPVDDVLMTTHIAADLLQRLVISQPKSPNDIPMLNATARNLSTYDFFDKSIQKIAALLNVLDPRSEESRQIFQLLLAFCQVDELRAPTCAAIIAVEPIEQKLNTPAHAMVNTARLSFEEAIFPEVPLVAMQLLAFIIKESVDAGKGIRRIFSSSSSDPLCALISQTMRTVRIDPQSPLAPFQAKQIAEGLRMAESLANDDDFRRDLLDIMHAQLCADIFDHHLGTNPMVNHWLFTDTLLLSPSSSQTYNDGTPPTSISSKGGPSLPLWSINAVAIPIQLMRLLASLKDHSKAHKELYWRSLKDHRLLPFVAYAIARGNNTLVYDAFVLFTHCAQLHDFPLKKLSILTSKCASLKNASRSTLASAAAACGQQMQSSKDVSFTSSFEQQQQQMSSHDYAATINISNGSSTKNNSREEAEIGEMIKLVTRLQSKLEAKEMKEKELEQKLSSMAHCSMVNGGRVVTDGGNGMGGNASSADQNIRTFVNALERRVVESEAEIAALGSEKRELSARIEWLEKALEAERVQSASAMDTARRDRQLLADENDRERALHAVMRDKFDDMKRKFDTAAKTVFDKQLELDKMQKTDEHLNKQFHEQSKELERHRTELETATKMVAARDIELTKRENELDKCTQQNIKLSTLRQQMAQLLDEFGTISGN